MREGRRIAAVGLTPQRFETILASTPQTSDEAWLPRCPHPALELKTQAQMIIAGVQ